jgi:3-hydroxybutyryl-CoA dehydrogenase
MKILIIGEKERTNALKSKLSEEGSVDCFDKDIDFAKTSFESYEVIFDLNMDDHPEKFHHLAKLEGKDIFVSALKMQLAEMLKKSGMDNKPQSRIYGINALAGFIDRSLNEVSLLEKANAVHLNDLAARLSLELSIVEDRVGMVSPRIIFMIINEACYTLQEGTAGIRDIDLGLKLGTNYPFGPFEWADKIGIKNVYECLHAIYHDTGDERYKICPLLKTYYLKNESFY